MLINLSNHHSNSWNKMQLQAALKKYKTVVDFSFPAISPRANKSQIDLKAKKYLEKILKQFEKSNDKHNAVHLMGEFTFVFKLVLMLKRKNIIVVASTTERISEEKNGKKIVQFNFVKFREY